MPVEVASNLLHKFVVRINCLGKQLEVVQIVVRKTKDLLVNTTIMLLKSRVDAVKPIVAIKVQRKGRPTAAASKKRSSVLRSISKRELVLKEPYLTLLLSRYFLTSFI